MAPKRAGDTLHNAATRVAPAASGGGSWGFLLSHPSANAATPSSAAAGPVTAAAPAAASAAADRDAAIDAGIDAWSGALDEAGGGRRVRHIVRPRLNPLPAAPPPVRAPHPRAPHPPALAWV